MPWSRNEMPDRNHARRRESACGRHRADGAAWGWGRKYSGSSGFLRDLNRWNGSIHPAVNHHDKSGKSIFEAGTRDFGGLSTFNALARSQHWPYFTDFTTVLWSPDPMDWKRPAHVFLESSRGSLCKDGTVNNFSLRFKIDFSCRTSLCMLDLIAAMRVIPEYESLGSITFLNIGISDSADQLISMRRYAGFLVLFQLPSKFRPL